jgi:hypothetical protein
MFKPHLTLILAFGLASCSTGKLGSSSPYFFQGFPPADCKYIGYVSSDFTGDSPNEGYDGSRKILRSEALKSHANSIRVVNYNMAENTFKLSAEVYYCSAPETLKKDQNETFFNLDDTN